MMVKSAILTGPNVEFTVLGHKVSSIKHLLRRFTHMVIALLRKNISSSDSLVFPGTLLYPMGPSSRNHLNTQNNTETIFI